MLVELDRLPHDGGRVVLQPRERFGAALLLEQGRDGRAHGAMVVIDPLDLRIGQHVGDNELVLDGKQRAWPERHERSLACVRQRPLGFRHDFHHVFDSNGISRENDKTM